MSKVTASKSVVLRRKKTVFSRAHFWKIPHDSGAEDIHLKIGRYKITEDLEDALEKSQPKSELTLDHEEFQGLLKFLGENYEPFRKGVKAFIPLDSPFDIENARQIKALFSLPDRKELVSFILRNEVIPEEFEAGLRQAQRVKAVKPFEAMLGGSSGASWQSVVRSEQLGTWQSVRPSPGRAGYRRAEHLRLPDGGLRRVPGCRRDQASGGRHVFLGRRSTTGTMSRPRN